MILMTVGCVIGAWMVSGVVPTIIYYGLKFLSPKVFLPVGFIVTCLVSFFVGSSYSAIATIGVALMGAIFGIICAFIFQSGHYSFKVILNALGTGFKIDPGSAAVDRLVNRGGISGVFSTVALCMLVLGMAELLQKFSVLSVVLKKTEAFIKSPRSLVITTIITCLFTTCITASQYVSIIVPGELMKDAYTKFGVQKKVLSRTLEDAGTIFAFIIPWSTTGIYVSGVLDMAVTEYIPYCFFALLCPVIAVIFALTGFARFKEKTETAEAVEE